MGFYEGLKENEKKLLDGMKNDLDYTFPDDGIDRKIWNAMKRGMKRLDEIAGCEMDYNLAGVHKTLLLNYCRYDLAGKADEFEKNYQSQIIAMQIDREMEAYAGKNSL